MDVSEVLARFFSGLASRSDGILALRFIVQPLISSGLAIRDGIRDARVGHLRYVWIIRLVPGSRRVEFHEGLKATATVIGLAAILDVAYQVVEMGSFHPIETIVVALGLGFIPYLLIRDPAACIAHWWISRSAPPRHG